MLLLHALTQEFVSVCVCFFFFFLFFYVRSCVWCYSFEWVFYPLAQRSLRFRFNIKTSSYQTSDSYYKEGLIAGRKPRKMVFILIDIDAETNGRHFPDDIFKCIFFNENVLISIKISPKFVPNGQINKIPSLV